MHDKALFFDLHSGLRIDRESNSQGVGEAWFEMLHQGKACAKLGVKGLPGNSRRFAKRVQPVGKPYVDVDCQ